MRIRGRGRGRGRGRVRVRVRVYLCGHGQLARCRINSTGLIEFGVGLWVGLGWGLVLRVGVRARVRVYLCGHGQLVRCRIDGIDGNVLPFLTSIAC